MPSGGNTKLHLKYVLYISTLRSVWCIKTYILYDGPKFRLSQILSRFPFGVFFFILITRLINCRTHVCNIVQVVSGFDALTTQNENHFSNMALLGNLHDFMWLFIDWLLTVYTLYIYYISANERLTCLIICSFLVIFKL